MPQRQLQQIPQNTKEAQQMQEATRKGAVGCGIAWLLLISVIAMASLGHGSGFAMIPLLFMIPFFAVGFGMIAWGLAPTLRAMKVTPPEIDITPESARLGESFDVTYRQQFKAPLDVDFVKFSFVMRETATYRRGTDTYTEKHEIPIAQHDLPGHRYQTGEQLNLHYRFTVPPNAMHTFLASNNRIEWLIRVHVSIARWPDVSEEYPVRVLPERYGFPNPDAVGANRWEDV